MSGELRGIAAAVALAAVLTGCGSGGDGGGVWGGQDEKPASLDSTQMLMALPSKLSAPDGWKGRDPVVKTGERALDICQNDTESNCAGVVAVGTTRLFMSGESSKKIRYGLYSFDTPQNAGVAMKGTVAEERKDAGSAARDLNVDVGADATEAFADGDNDCEVIMRVGSVVIRMQGVEVSDEPTVRKFAQLQVERVRQASAGQNPDA
ncbi:hypothetical protein [Streptomyces sp. TRM49041]|uniref:hypothetical protein n=1 Tax=Streptomyces sp. TRM49041 TaxID=2603216 RepID=UPI0011ED1648|nr:hypothetical protein [Streptomyces sp. TRM49041]